MIDADVFQRLHAIGMTARMFQQTLNLAPQGAETCLMRVTEVQRDCLTLHDGQSEHPARALPALLSRLHDEADGLAVGDWVWAALHAHGEWWAHQRVPPLTQIARRLHDGRDKVTRRWENEATPYVTPEAMAAIRALGVQHLLIDLPSVDPLVDGGVLAAHRVYWDMPPGSLNDPGKYEGLRTITELIYVPGGVKDGRYVLNLQTPHFVSDAAPSRPILFHLEDEA